MKLINCNDCGEDGNFCERHEPVTKKYLCPTGHELKMLNESFGWCAIPLVRPADEYYLWEIASENIWTKNPNAEVFLPSEHLYKDYWSAIVYGPYKNGILLTKEEFLSGYAAYMASESVSRTNLQKAGAGN